VFGAAKRQLQGTETTTVCVVTEAAASTSGSDQGFPTVAGVSFCWCLSSFIPSSGQQWLRSGVVGVANKTQGRQDLNPSFLQLQDLLLLNLAT
jgi:hypothetical protein